MDEATFVKWCKENQVTDATVRYIQTIIKSPPVRNVNGGRSNVCGHFASRKMGVTIQFESGRSAELAALKLMEHDPEVLGFYDQPVTIQIRYPSKSGKTTSAPYTPDFLVIRRDSACMEEWKVTSELEDLSEKRPHRYCKDENGQWRCPPVEEYFSQKGITYSLRVFEELNLKFLNNISLISNYPSAYEPANEANDLSTIKKFLAEYPCAKLSELLESGYLNHTSVYRLILRDMLIIDLNENDLCRPHEIVLFETTDGIAGDSILNYQTDQTPVIRDYRKGQEFFIDGILFKLQKVESDQCHFTEMLSAKTIQFDIKDFEKMVSRGRIIQTSLSSTSANKYVMDKYKNASIDDWKIAQHRWQILREWLNTGICKDPGISERTLYRWKGYYVEAQKICGHGLLGLLPRKKERGNRKMKLGLEQMRLIEQTIDEDYQNNIQKSATKAYGALLNRCGDAKVQPPSYQTFKKYIDLRPIEQTVFRRQGSKAAYQIEPFYHRIDNKTPVHGLMPFNIAHIDSTELDIELIDSQNGEVLGRPWLTLMIDAYSRRILGIYLTYEKPSRISTMMVIRDCVYRFGRLPIYFVADNGKEHQNSYLHVLCGLYGINIMYRPPAQPRFGAPIERVFNTLNQDLIHNLQGNTKIMKNVRQVTAKVNPKNLAVYTIEDIQDALEYWAFELYDQQNHGTLGCSPRSFYQQALERIGVDFGKRVTYDSAFLIWTMPTIPRRKVMANPTRGVQVNGIHYWNEAFKTIGSRKTKVEVKYDPFDIGIVYAYLDKQWISCSSEYHFILHGRSEKERQFAVRELKKRNVNSSKKRQIRAAEIAAFLETMETAAKTREVVRSNNRIAAEPIENTIIPPKAIIAANPMERYGEFV